MGQKERQHYILNVLESIYWKLSAMFEFEYSFNWKVLGDAQHCWLCGIWKKEMEDGDNVTFAKWNTINI